MIVLCGCGIKIERNNNLIHYTLGLSHKTRGSSDKQNTDYKSQPSRPSTTKPHITPRELTKRRNHQHLMDQNRPSRFEHSSCFQQVAPSAEVTVAVVEPDNKLHKGWECIPGPGQGKYLPTGKDYHHKSYLVGDKTKRCTSQCEKWAKKHGAGCCERDNSDCSFYTGADVYDYGEQRQNIYAGYFKK